MKSEANIGQGVHASVNLTHHTHAAIIKIINHLFIYKMFPHSDFLAYMHVRHVRTE